MTNTAAATTKRPSPCRRGARRRPASRRKHERLGPVRLRRRRVALSLGVGIAQPRPPVVHESSPSARAISRRPQHQVPSHGDGRHAERVAQSQKSGRLRAHTARESPAAAAATARAPARPWHAPASPVRDRRRRAARSCRSTTARVRTARCRQRVLADIDQHPDQPCFFIGRSDRNAVGRPRRAKERFLDKVGGIVRRAAPAAAPAGTAADDARRTEPPTRPAGSSACSVHRRRDRHRVRRHHWECRRRRPTEVLVRAEAISPVRCDPAREVRGPSTGSPGTDGRTSTSICQAASSRGQWTGPLSQLPPVDSENTRMCSCSAAMRFGTT